MAIPLIAPDIAGLGGAQHVARTTAALQRSRWALVFALLVPLQLISFGWLWFDSADKLSAQLNQATTELFGLRNRVNAAGSEAELQLLQASTIAGLLPPPWCRAPSPSKKPSSRKPLI